MYVHNYLRASHGHLLASKSLAQRFEQGQSVEQNMVKALDLWLFAAEQGDAMSMFKASLLIRNGDLPFKDSERALQLCLASANSGYVESWFPLAEMLLDRNRGHEAVDWLNKCISVGNKEAQFMLAQIYDQGLAGIEKDEEAAIDLWRSSAVTGCNASAQILLDRGIDT